MFPLIIVITNIASFCSIIIHSIANSSKCLEDLLEVVGVVITSSLLLGVYVIQVIVDTIIDHITTTTTTS
jgi:hypothetical protein